MGRRQDHYRLQAPACHLHAARGLTQSSACAPACVQWLRPVWPALKPDAQSWDWSQAPALRWLPAVEGAHCSAAAAYWEALRGAAWLVGRGQMHGGPTALAQRGGGVETLPAQ